MRFEPGQLWYEDLPTDALPKTLPKRQACRVFGLDESLLRTGPPVWGDGPRYRVPHDSSITAPRTERILRRPALTLDQLLGRFRNEYDEFTADKSKPDAPNGGSR